MSAPDLKPAVFLDRDGTINVEKDYLHRVEDFIFIPGAPEAIRRLNDAGYLVIVATNQSGVARGYFGLAEVEALHAHLVKELARWGARIDAFYACPHHPGEGVGGLKVDCDCRKGRPGMLLQAAEQHRIDLTRSYMIGDKTSDIAAGEAAGCRSILVLTGYGAEEARRLSREVPRCPDLAHAVDLILSSRPSVAG